MSAKDRFRPTRAEISLGRVRENANGLVALARKKGLDIIAVVKADGYGHGAAACARAALEEGAASLAVASPEEAIALRDAGIRAPILVMGAYVRGSAEAYAAYDLEATLSAFDQLESLESDLAGVPGAPIRVHLKVDTGMGRLGVGPDEALDFARAATRAGRVSLQGVFSHLATAEDDDPSYAEGQLRRFRKTLERLRAHGIHPRSTHILNSAGLLRHDPAGTNACRVGLALYGLYPAPGMRDVIRLLPAMEVKSEVVSVRHVPQGFGVSYGCKYVTPRDTTLAVLPVGYADGFTRRLNGQARVLIRGKSYPVVGAICMDQSIVDVGRDDVAVGDEAVILGRQGNEAVTAEMWAAMLDTINYEVICMIGRRVPRVYV